jgi:hypothetical protein
MAMAASVVRLILVSAVLLSIGFATPVAAAASPSQGLSRCEPAVTIDPSSGPAGSAVTVTVQCWLGEGLLQLGFKDEGGYIHRRIWCDDTDPAC